MAGELAIEDRLHERAERKAVVGADEVDGRAHEDRADDTAVEEERGELVRLKGLEARPQGRVGVQRDLGLEPDKVLDCVERAQRGTAEEKLTLERRSVQRPPAENLGFHVTTSGRPPGALLTA